VVNNVYSIGGLRHVEAREKMLFSRTFNEVVLGFLPEKGSMGPLKFNDNVPQLEDRTSVCSIYHFQIFTHQSVWQLCSKLNSLSLAFLQCQYTPESIA
jgi:hypothetical protein